MRLRTVLNLLLTVAPVVVVAPALQAEVPGTISYQGVLASWADSTAVPDGDYSMTFRLYEQIAGGSSIWEETRIVAITGGRFSVLLGSGSSLGNLDFDVPYYLGIAIGGGPELSPRAALTSSAYSLQSRTVMDNAVNSDKIENGTVQQEDLAFDPGDITAVQGGDGLQGGGDSGSVTLSVQAGPGIQVNTGGVRIANNGVTEDMLADDAVTSDKIADGAVTSADLSFEPGDITDVQAGNGLTGGGTAGSVSVNVGSGAGITVEADAVSVAAGGVSNDMLAPNAVTSDKIQDGTIQENDLGFPAGDVTEVIAGPGLAGGVSSGADSLYVVGGPGILVFENNIQVAPGEISESMLSSNSVTSSKIQNGTIQFQDIGPNGADDGQVMKRQADAWVAANDDGGIAKGNYYSHFTEVIPISANGSIQQVPLSPPFSITSNVPAYVNVTASGSIKIPGTVRGVTLGVNTIPGTFTGTGFWPQKIVIGQSISTSDTWTMPFSISEVFPIDGSQQFYFNIRLNVANIGTEIHGLQLQAIIFEQL